jgi:hypothetical protein
MRELERCKDRLKTIEELKIRYNNKTLRDKMEELDDLDSFARTKTVAQKDYTPTISKVFSVISISCTHIYQVSSIISKEQNVKILSYFPIEKRNF